MRNEKHSGPHEPDGTPEGTALMVRTIEHPLMVRTIEQLMAELLDENIPAGELRQIVKSTRQSIIEHDAELHSSPGISALARELTVELLFGRGMWEQKAAEAEIE